MDVKGTKSRLEESILTKDFKRCAELNKAITALEKEQQVRVHIFLCYTPIYIYTHMHLYSYKNIIKYSSTHIHTHVAHTYPYITPHI